MDTKGFGAFPLPDATDDNRNRAHFIVVHHGHFRFWDLAPSTPVLLKLFATAKVDRTARSVSLSVSSSAQGAIKFRADQLCAASR
jgi:hypothetical protein